MKIGLVLLFSLTYIEATLSLQTCPPGPIWGIRANNTCKNKDTYHCLLDTEYAFRNEERYKEICLSPKRYKGVQYVYSGDLDAKDCNPSRFSPVPYWSNTGFECPLMKSSCNEEGQVIAKNGSSSTDRSCRCDYRKMYDYVMKPSDPCHCHPMEEDCSCYIHRCSSTSQVLSQDYNCVAKDTRQTFVCTSIEDQTIPVQEIQTPLTENRTLTNSSFNTLKCNVMVSSLEFACNKFVATLTVLALAIGIIVGLLVDLLWRRWTVRDTSNFKVIYRQKMMTAPFYIETKELKMLNKHFTKTHESRFVILQGMHGTGKTQTSIKFCKDTQNSYALVAMISPSEDLTLEEALVKFLTRDLKVNILRSSDLTLDYILDELEGYLNHKNRKRCPCLLVVDISSNKKALIAVQKFLELQKRIPNLNLIFETTDTNLSIRFQGCCKVHFDGMNKDEILKLLNNCIENSKEDENSINILVNAIGNFPLVLVSAISYMKKTSISSIEFCKISKNEEAYFDAISHFKDESYDRFVLETLTIPLKRIKTIFVKNPELWDILSLITLLDFQSISVVVLEACYRHLANCGHGTKVVMVGRLLMIMDNYSLCQTLEQEQRSTYTSGQNDHTNICQGKEKRRMLKFHALTIKALEIVSEVREKREKWIRFLLESFCYELDIDSRTDKVVNRNLLFFNHAEKLITLLDQLDCQKDNEFRFYKAYIHCALGSTLLYHRQNVESAHIHLMKARHIVLSIVGDESRYHEKVCSRIRSSTDGSRRRIDSGLNRSSISFQEISKERIEKVAKSIFEFSFSFKFTKDFFHGKRRSHHDIDILKSEGIKDAHMFNEHYLSDKDYDELLSTKLVLSIDEISKTILLELFMWICQNNARSLIDLKYIILENDLNLTETCKEECLLAKHFSQIAISKEMNLFVCLENFRSIRMLLRLSEPDTDVPKLEKDVEDLEAMLKPSETDNPYFGFGFIKASSKSNFRHTILCRPILLRYLRKIIVELKDEDKKHKLREKGSSITDELRRQLKDMKDENLNYNWLSVPFAFIECAKFLHTALEIYEDALECFKEALAFEKKREVFWTRYIKDSYVGQIKCLFKLDKPVEAKDLYKSVKGKLEGTNRENLIDSFQQLYKTCKADHRSAKQYDRCELDHESTILHDT